MAVYFCKCGRQVNKSTNADNTGNRDTAQCTGCPYLLPWGPDKYVEGQGFHKDVQGYECRMSPTLCYTTTYRGQASDKCTLHILSLDLDFLDTVQAWIDDHAAATLSAGFSRGSMRGTDFSDKGRYSLSISCAQNKKGIAAKAALIEQFFTGGRVRKDMTPAQEKARILAAIRRGKENASNMKYTISEHQNGLMYAYYKERFWFWHKDQNKWVPSAFATQQYDKAKAKDSGITPEMLLDNGSFNVLEEYQVPLQRLTALEALTPADSQVPAPDDREITKAPPAAAPASAEPPEIVDECSEPDEECPYLQPLENSKKYSCQCALCGDKFVNREICNKSFRGCGWYQDQQEKDARQDDEEEIPTTDSCQCRTCEHESCFAHGCTKECPANAEESCLTTSCPEYREKPQFNANPPHAARNAQPCVPGASGVQPSPYRSADAGAKEGANDCKADGAASQNCPFYDVKEYSDNSEGHFCHLCGSLKRPHKVCLGKYKDDWHKCDVFIKYDGAEQLLTRNASSSLSATIQTTPTIVESSDIADDGRATSRPCPGDVYRSAKGGQLYKIGELTNGKKTCYLTMRSNAQGGTWVPANSSVYPNLSDAQGEFEAWIRTKQLEPVAPTGAAAATTDASAAPQPSQAAGTTTTSASGAGASTSMPQESGISGRNSSPAPGCPAEAGDAASVAIPAASPVATPSNLPAFDYSGLDVVTVDTLHLAENIIRSARQKYIVDLAGAVDMAHEELVRNSDGHNQHTEETFVAWCRSVGISKTTAYQLLQVQALITGSTPEEQAVLEAASPSLLYVAAKPSAPAELVQAVKDGDITTHKQYQEALAEIRARDAKITDLLDMSEAADRRADKAEQAAKDTARERDAALRRAAEAEKQRDGARDALTASKLRGDKLKAENEALKARPIEARVVDEEEIERRAQARADELTAPMREELEALRARHPADLEEAEQAIRDAYDSAIYTGRVMENAWHTLRPLLPRMDAHRRELAINQVSKTLSQIQGEIAACL